MNNIISIFTDGGSRGNPGDSAYGFSIVGEDGKEIAGIGKRIGITTNNVAEYKAVIEAFNWLLSHREYFGKTSVIKVFMDSKLICSQLSGLFKVKHPNMVPLFIQAKQNELKLNARVSYTHIPREKNKVADGYVNAALDNAS